MVAVAGGPDRYVAVGRAWLADGQDVGMAWVSEDGVSWRRAAPWFNGIPTGLIHDRVGYLAWGSWRGSAAVWVSPDGIAWDRAQAIPSFRNAGIDGIARLGDQLVAVGGTETETGDGVIGESRTWTSPDGIAWTVLEAVTPIPSDVNVNGLTAAEGLLVAWGSAPLGDTYAPVTLRSPDGRRWEIGWVKPGVEGYESEGMMDMVGVGDRLVAVGFGLQGEAPSPAPPSAAWTSGDGLTWEPAVFESQPASGWLLHVAWSGDEYVALGLRQGAWQSADGTAWVRSESSPDVERDGWEVRCTPVCGPNTSVSDLTAGPAGLVAVGESRMADETTRSVAWIARAD